MPTQVKTQFERTIGTPKTPKKTFLLRHQTGLYNDVTGEVTMIDRALDPADVLMDDCTFLIDIEKAVTKFIPNYSGALYTLNLVN